VKRSLSSIIKEEVVLCTVFLWRLALKWKKCVSFSGNDTRCMSDIEDSGGCSVYNETGMCQSEQNTDNHNLPTFANECFIK